MSDEIDHDRRRLLSAAAMSVRRCEFIADRAFASPPAFGPLKQIDAGVLNAGYAEAVPRPGPAAILLHGWPYDIHSYAGSRTTAGTGWLSA